VANQRLDPLGLVEALADAGVELIIVGGGAAVLHGSPVLTADLDIVHRRTPENVERLLLILARLDACFRGDLAGRRLAPSAQHLLGSGQLLLSTALGPLDCLCVLHDGRGFDELLPHTVTLAVEGRSVRVLDLDTLIEVKTKAGREKDKLTVGHLLLLRAKRGA
jgi:hypothetical protein